MPANLIAFQWRLPSSGSGNGEHSARLFVDEAGSARELTVTTSTSPDGLLIVRPSAAIAAGARLRLETTGRGCDGISALTTRVVVSPAAPLPTRLGVASLAASGQKPLQVGVRTGECFLPMQAAFAEISLALSAEAAPYRDLMRYALHIDGEPTLEYEAPADWRGTNYIGDPPLGHGFLGRTTFRVFAPCEAESRPEAPQWPAPGAHTVSVVGTLPDGRAIESDELRVDLRCATAAPSTGGADASGAAPHEPAAPPQMAVEPESGTEASVPVGSVPSTSAAPAVEIDGERAVPASADASCALYQGTQGPAGLTVLPLLALSLRRARRRRASKRSARLSAAAPS